MSESHPRSILDPIHGLIRLTKLEFAILSHRLFQRLRFIKQNGLLHLVFPSATHTRFEHSLGALFLAEAILESVRLNSIVARAKGAVVDPSDARIDVAVDFNTVPREVVSWINRIARLAALAHDLGHGPLSHTFDSFAPRREKLLAALQAGTLPALTDHADVLAAWKKDGMPGSTQHDRVPHEVMSCVLLCYILLELQPDEQAELDIRPQLGLEVAAAILGLPQLAPHLAPDYQQWLPFIHDVIASAPADADRMDYLERDSRSLGVTYGLFDKNRVLKSFLCFRAPHESGTAYRLGIKRSGLAALENFVQARFELYVQIYYHKTNVAISLMLREIATQALKSGVDLFSSESPREGEALRELVEWYLELSDDRFLNILAGRDPRFPAMPEAIKHLASAIERRALWKRVFEDDEAGARYVVGRLKAGSDVRSEQIILDVSRPKATKDLKTGATLLERREDGLYVADRSLGWFDRSIVIDALHEAEGNIGRVFVRDEATRGDLLTHIRRLCRAHAFAYNAIRAQRQGRWRELLQEAKVQLNKEFET